MNLRKYQQKRKFDKTPEPVGKVVRRKGKPIFVVHEHWARSHHFDFRLQMKGVLKSWAVPKGPPEKVGEKRLAVQVEDHPLDYGSFEGIIPEGQYGAGRVKVWDKGKVKFKRQDKEIIEFELSGKKLKGRFTLLHPAKFEAKNWLFLKNS